MLDELYELDEEQLDFVEETEKPYDKYLKLHNYDPKQILSKSMVNV